MRESVESQKEMPLALILNIAKNLIDKYGIADSEINKNKRNPNGNSYLL
jgi:hypothetical protein